MSSPRRIKSILPFGLSTNGSGIWMGVRSGVVTSDLLSAHGVWGRPLIEAQIDEEAMQLLECAERNFRRTQLHSRAYRGV